LVHALAHAYAAGLSIDWSVLYPCGKRSDAPTYSFEPSECGELLFYSRSSRPGSDSGARQSASLYREAWKPCSRVGASSHERRASLFFAQNADGALESLPPDAHAIVCGKQLRQIGPHLWEAPVESPQHLIDIVAALDMERSGVDLVLVAPSVSPLEAAEFHRRNSRAMSLAILLAQFAIGRAMNGIATRLHLISQRGRAVRQRESEEPTLAGLCALMQVLRLEYPLAAGHTIDLDCSDDSLPACAHRELQAPHDCDEYALRDGRVFERRIEPVTLPPYPASLSIHADRTYLITGGTGGLGLQTAAALVQRGARHLLLVSRSGRPSTSRETQHLRTLRDAGVSIDIRAADVTDEAALEQIVTDLESGPYKLAGIVHAAGTNQIGRLLDLNSNDALSLIAPKVVGLHHLLRLTQSMPLDFICCYSSIAASWGSGGMAAYSAANRTMNALAAAARTAGRKVSVICWGPWRDSGMAASSVDLARDTGLMPISDSEGIRLFKQLLSGDSDEWIVARLDIDRFSDLYLMKARTRLFTLLRSQITCDAADPSNEVMGEHPLMAVVENDRAYVLQDHLLQLVRDTLNLEADDDVSIDHSLHDLGITSLQALEIRNALNLYTGLKLPGTLLFEYPTVREIARFILASLQPQALENA
jgi:myxalamid-type polyketide synthase MxaC